MTDSETIKLRIPGYEEASFAGDGTRYRIQAGRAAGDPKVVEVRKGQVVEIVFADGMRIWTSAGRLTEEMLDQSERRDADGVIEIPHALDTDTASRGWIGRLVIRTLTFFGFDPAKSAAEKIAKRFERKTLELDADGRSELFRPVLLPDLDDFRLDRVSAAGIPTDRPHLLFLHGTASSTGGSFGGLWTAEGLTLREQLQRRYGDRVLAFEHRTLTKSPIDNAIRLAEKLPARTKLHIVSHSRGGLVGELIARAAVAAAAGPFSAAELELWSELDADEQRGDLRRLNRLLAEKRFEVEKFVRVACPSRGTSLASGRLDIYLSIAFNLLGRLPFLKLPGIHIAFDIFEELIKDIARTRADPDILPGLEAMVPDSPLIRLVNHPNATVDGVLRVIAGDIEGESVGSAIAALLTDPLYQRNHDLVVDTEAMFGGAARTGGAAYAFHQGADVSHFRYFSNERSASHLVRALEADDGVPDGFETYEAEPTDRTIIVASRSAQPRPTVFVIPGLMGSHLTVGGQRVWLDLGHLALGGVGRLDIKAMGIGAEGLIQRYYGKLIQFLGRTYDVIPFPYDWRRSLAEAADRLAEEIERRRELAGDGGLPVSIVAHSMGGLVARLMIARHPDLWSRLSADTRPSRLIMLGTPQQGSHAVPFMLTGRDSLIRKLAFLDLRNSRKELLKIVADYPGVLELLPSHGSMDLFSKASWEALFDADEDALKADGGKADEEVDVGWHVPAKGDLDRALKVRNKLDSGEIDPERMFCIAGWAPATPSDVVIERDGDGHRRIAFMATGRGDGRVPWSTGGLDGVKTWYMNAAHGDLTREEHGFPAIADLLEKGKTLALSETPPRARGAGDQFELAAERSPLFPTYDDLAISALGGAARDRREKIATKMRVDVVHGNLAFASHPVMVGHYEGDTIVSAEAHLDRALGGQLTRRHRLGRYPGSTTESAIVLNEGGKPSGAIVIGIGQVGKLSPGALMQAVSNGIRDYVLAIAEQGGDPDGGEVSQRFPKVTTLLIGTGAGGLQITDSVSSILRGIASANDALEALEDRHRTAIDRVEIIELYEDRAIQAAQALRKLKDDPQLRDRIVSDSEFRIQLRRGGRTRAAYFEPEGWWQRLQIVQDDNGRLDFKLLTNRARAEMHTQSTQRRLVDSFIDKVVDSVQDDPEIGVTLYEMLVPLELKQYAPEQRDLVLVLNPAAARYPWELMRPQADRHPGPDGALQRPTTIDIGVVRQLQQIEFRQDVVNANTNFALVIGDPKSRLVALPRARAEAKAVAERLDAAGYEAPALIAEDAGADVIMKALHARHYRLLHLAGHGVYAERGADGAESSWFKDVDEGIVAGMVIGDDLLLTPAEVRQMRAVPEVVFINCCHVGAMSEDDEPLPNNPPRLAATLATEFIRMGVRAVVAAGWAIDDEIAETFAASFYDQLLAGETFGSAVKRARQAAYEADPRSNTWGAYQCYGDPAFTLTVGRGADDQPPGTQDLVSVKELIVELENKTKDAATAKASQLEWLDRAIRALEQDVPDQWQDDPALHAAFGEAFAELGDFDKAIEHYRAAIEIEDARASLKVLEQLSNVQTRLAASLPASRDADAADLMNEAEARLMGLNDLVGETSERLILLGSIAKRRFRFAAEDKDREERLAIMEGFYKKAYEKARDEGDKPANPYPRVNELAATILTHIIGNSKSRVPASCVKALAAAREDALRRDQIEPNYWDAVVGAECLLLEKLAGRDITADDEQAVVAAVLDAGRRDGSPRELRSVREQLAFLESVIDERSSRDERRNLAQAIGRIRTRLEM